MGKRDPDESEERSCGRLGVGLFLRSLFIFIGLFCNAKELREVCCRSLCEVSFHMRSSLLYAQVSFHIHRSLL